MRNTNKEASVSIRSLLMAFFAALMLVGSLALAGCGGGGESSESEAPAEEEQAADEEEATEEEEESKATRTAEEAAEGYIQAVFDGDGEALWELLPPDLRDAMMEEVGGDEDEVIATLESEISDAMGSTSLEGMEDYVNGFTVEATDSQELSSSEVDDLIDTYDSDYGLNLNIEEAMEVDVTIGLDLTAEGEAAIEEAGNDVSDAETEATVVAIMVDGEWYFDMTSLL